jgi:hypothetical protein
VVISPIFSLKIISKRFPNFRKLRLGYGFTWSWIGFETTASSTVALSPTTKANGLRLGLRTR